LPSVAGTGIGAASTEPTTGVSVDSPSGAGAVAAVDDVSGGVVAVDDLTDDDEHDTEARATTAQIVTRIRHTRGRTQ
jgi:hypothetical protein